MRISDVKAKRVIKFTTIATLKDLDKFTGTTPNQLYAEAARLGYQTWEPQIWQYTGADGKPETEFKLEIMLPIHGEGNGLKSDKFEIAEAAEFKALQTLHEGPWAEIAPVYCSLMKQVAETGLQTTNITREVYVRCDFENQENCITEVMIGIK
ncbi:MAG: hypothetical protein MJZ18_09540 [Bacteroidales bacterium]|nr:hypothetical protein [Bacteroidales bacterium]